MFGAFGLEHETRMKVEKRIANAKKIFVLITVVFKIRYKNTTKNLNMQEMKRFFLYRYQKKEVSLSKISLEGMKRKLGLLVKMQAAIGLHRLFYKG